MTKKDREAPERIQEEKLELYAENAELKLRLDEYSWQMDEIHRQEQEIRKLHQDVRKLRHDMQNHLLVIASYLRHEEAVEAEEYISDILDRLRVAPGSLETGNSLLHHILNEKLSLAREKGIDVSARVDPALFEKMKGIDFAAILNNVLDNAIEASEREAVKELRVRVFRQKGYDAISVKNRIKSSVLETNPKLQSTKAGGQAAPHGFGVAQIKETAERYQGMYDFYEEDGFFCVNVFIPQ